MRSTVERDVRAAVADEARRATDPLELERAVAAQLSRAVPFELWCGLTTDPWSGNPTGGFHEEGLPDRHMGRLIEIEQQEVPDFGALRELVPSTITALTLGRATGGDLRRSSRYRDVLEPSGVGHEVRVAMRGSDGLAWGAIVLMRAVDDRDFSGRELELLSAVGRHVADGLRRAMTLSAHPSRHDEAPGLVLCTVTESDVCVDHVSESARVWLEEVDDGQMGLLPVALGSLVLAAHRRAADHRPHRVRLRTRSGRWVTAHAERLGDLSVSVILEATRSHELADLLADAFRLTVREREVAALAGQGLSNREIAASLYLSPYTVADHLKSVFAKTGTANRAELASRWSR